MASTVWVDGTAYEAYVGRWSRLVAAAFVRWLGLPGGLRWLDVGSGTGVLTSTVLATAQPRQVTGVDSSEGFVRQARAQATDPRTVFTVGDARVLPLPDSAVDVVVSGLVLNFVPEPARAVAEFARVAVPGGLVAAYVWDYAEGMEMMRQFWDAANELDSAAAGRDDGRRFALCRPEALQTLWREAGLTDVSVEAVVVPTVFTGFADYWTPFLGGQGSAPAYLSSLAEPQRVALRDLLAARLPTGPDGSIRLTARAWAIRGTRPTGV
ncbi:methyltransferase domain-containing protein [Micromonospora sp. NPDC005979]|uniref:class I SAM-dependent methyltransferase n=1 Tax=Micromonospora sp. NPDC005979 TaxID=3156726 RepID=UPI0033B85651